MTKTARAGLRESRLLLRSISAVWQLIPLHSKAALTIATFLMAVAAWANALVPVYLGDLANAIDAAQRAGRAWGMADSVGFLLALALMFVARELLHVARKYLVHRTTTNTEKDITVRLVNHLMHADLGLLAGGRIGALNGRIRRSAEGFVTLLKLSFMDLFPSVVVALFAVAMAMNRDILLGLVMAAVAPVASFIVARQIVSQKGVRLELLRKKEDVDAAVVEQLSGIEYVRAANTHDYEIERVTSVCEAVRARELRHHVHMSLFDFCKAINESTFLILVISLSLLLAARGKLAVGEIITFSMLFGNIITPLREIHRILDEAHESAIKVADLLDLMSEPVDESFAVDCPAEPLLDGTVPAIEVSNLSLEYRASDGSDHRALSNVSLSISANCVVGVAGPSGSGKSTWLRALLRLAHPLSGDIRIGGVPITDVSRETIARLIGYVGQSPFLFAGTVADNISYGTGITDRTQIATSAEAAGILNDIEAMPGGLDAKVFEGGRNLSGGQRQRIAIARVFLKGPRIIIFDEATSALDNQTERLVQESLKEILVMRLPYYVGLLTAAAQHGASHQQPQEFQVIADRSVRPLTAGRIKIRFFASQYMERAAAANIKTPTGTMRVSTPETTAVDLVRFAKAAGYLDNVATVLAELVSSLDPKRLLTAVRLVNDVPNAKRLGYLLDHVGGKGLCGPLHAWIQRQSPRPVPLRPGRPLTDAPEDRRWHVLVNQPIEVEA